MKPLNRIGGIIMIVGLFSFLFSCSSPKSEYGPLQSFSLSNLAQEKTESYCFNVTFWESGETTINGYCYDEENEYKITEDVNISGYTAYMLNQMEIEHLATKKSPKMYFFGIPFDKTKRTATVTHTNGTTREVNLSQDMHKTITSLLSDELKSAIESAAHGVWSKIYFSQSGGDNFSNYFSFTIEQNPDGIWIATGFCSDTNGVQYESENGIIISDETISEIRSLKLEKYAKERKIENESFDDLIILDGEITTLTLVFDDGHMENKDVYYNVTMKLFNLLLNEFKVNS